MKAIRKNLPSDIVLNKKYIIGKTLGSGSFGTTYIAFDSVLKQTVAIKEYFPSNLCLRKDDLTIAAKDGSEDIFEEGKQKFKEEALLIFGSFDVPGICSVKDYFEENNTVYIVQEHMPGGTLKEKLDIQGKIDIKQCLEIFNPVMQGLAIIHSKGIVHMDISPDNLMFDSEGNLKLIDFGAAKLITSKNENMEFKISYAPPEQYEDIELTGPWSDIYALCSTMYQCVSGRKPEAASKRIKKDRLKHIDEITETDHNFTKALEQGLSLDVRKRYFSVINFMEKIGMDTAKVSGLNPKLREVWGNRWIDIIITQKAEYENSSLKGLAKRKVKRIPIVLVAMVLTIVLLCLIAGIWTINNPEKYFDYVVNEAKATAYEEEDYTVSKGYELYDKILAVAEPVDENQSFYKISENDFKKLKLTSNETQKAYIDYKTLKKICNHYLSVKLEEESTEFKGYIEEKNDRLIIYGIKECIYTWDSSSDSEQIRIKYDAGSQRVVELEARASREVCETILRYIFPYLVPEMSFTYEEIYQITQAIYKEEFTPIISHPKFKLKGFINFDDGMCNMVISNGEVIY